MTAINEPWLNAFNGRLNRHLQSQQQKHRLSGHRSREQLMKISQVALVAVDHLQNHRGLVRLSTEDDKFYAYYWISRERMQALRSVSLTDRQRSAIARDVARGIARKRRHAEASVECYGSSRGDLADFSQTARWAWTARNTSNKLAQAGFTGVVFDPGVEAPSKDKQAVLLLSTKRINSSDRYLDFAIRRFKRDANKAVRGPKGRLLASINRRRNIDTSDLSKLSDRDFIFWSLTLKYNERGRLKKRSSRQVLLLKSMAYEFNRRLDSTSFWKVVYSSRDLQLIGLPDRVDQSAPQARKMAELAATIDQLEAILYEASASTTGENRN